MFILMGVLHFLLSYQLRKILILGQFIEGDVTFFMINNDILHVNNITLTF